MLFAVQMQRISNTCAPQSILHFAHEIETIESQSDRCPKPLIPVEPSHNLFQTYVCREHSGLYLCRASQASFCSEITWEA